MNEAKELADKIRNGVKDAAWCRVTNQTATDIAAHLDRLAAIDSATTGEVGQIDRVHRAVESHRNVYGIQPRDAHDAHRDRGILLTIVQRQAGEIAALKQEYFAATLAIEQTLHDTEQRSDAARAEVERLKLEVAALRAERDHLATTRMEASAEIDRLQTERAALAQENARLINEVGELDAAAREQRLRAEVLARGIAAYRSGSFTLAQVWENEEGKAVT